MTNASEQLSPADAVRAAVAAIPAHPWALLTEVQAAEVLNVSIRTLQAWRLRGGGPRFVRLSGRAVRYRNSDLASYIEAHTVVSTSDPGPSGDAAAGAAAPAEG